MRRRICIVYKKKDREFLCVCILCTVFFSFDFFQNFFSEFTEKRKRIKKEKNKNIEIMEKKRKYEGKRIVFAMTQKPHTPNLTSHYGRKKVRKK
jgi:hypothetical protein